MPTHVDIYSHARGEYRDTMNNLAGEVWVIFVSLVSTKHRHVDVYTVVLPYNLVETEEQLPLLYRTWPREADGETLILQALLGEPG